MQLLWKFRMIEKNPLKFGSQNEFENYACLAK